MRVQHKYRTACYVDTGFFYAILDQSDKWHGVCKQIIDEVRSQSRRLVTTTYVVAETHALLLYKLGQNIATPWLRDIRMWVEVHTPPNEDENRAIAIIEQYANQPFTFTDAVSFAVIESLRIPVALAVDKHFVIYKGSFLTAPLTIQTLSGLQRD